MTDPAELRYTTEHEWVADPDGPTARVGVTAFAVAALGDVVYLSLPEVGAAVTAGAECGEIESTKSVSPLYAPVTGTVAAVNEAALAAPEIVNADPFGEGWLFEVAQPQSGGHLLDAAAYAALTAAE
ncbi:MAG: glycine cleavage system protein GcvH [Propionibacteriaceae bacterium]|jgi:glycine cleavage system H protein|nr:glycine cleavage system protein GcvH [Propionibacteriaceae bacterium]